MRDELQRDEAGGEREGQNNGAGDDAEKGRADERETVQ